MHRLSPLLVVSVTGCLFGGPSSVGTWEGTCSSSFTDEDIPVTLAIETDDKGELDGAGIYLSGGLGVESALTGTRQGKQVELTLAPPELSGSTTLGLGTALSPDLSFDLELRGDSMEGSCSMSVFGFSVPLTGTFERVSEEARLDPSEPGDTGL